MDGWVDGGGWGRFDTQFLSDLHLMSYVFLFIGEVYMHLVAFESMSSPSTHTCERRKCHLSQGSLAVWVWVMIEASEGSH